MYTKVGATVGNLVSAGSVTGVDRFGGDINGLKQMTIPAVNVIGETVYYDAYVTLGSIVSINGGMPACDDDQCCMPVIDN